MNNGLNMKRIVLVIFGIFLLAFAVITYLKHQSPGDRPPAAQQSARIAHRDSVTKFWAVYREATEYRIRGELEQAARKYTEALSLNDRHEDALYYGGNVYYQLGRFQDAKRAWARLIQVNPLSTRAYIELGDLYLTEEYNLEEAKPLYLRAFQISQEETGPLIRLARVAVLVGNLPQAEQYYQDILRAYSNREAYLLTGYIAWRTGAEQKAFDLFGKSVNYTASSSSKHAVSNEGDTKTGNPMEYGQMEGLFDSWLRKVVQVGAGYTRQDMTEMYQAIRSYLQTMRTKVHAGAVTNADSD